MPTKSKEIPTIGYLIDQAQKTSKESFNVESMSPSAKNAYKSGLLHLIPYTLPGSAFVGISFAEENWRGQIVESRLDKNKPFKTYEKKELVEIFWTHGEYGFKRAFPYFWVNADFERTKYVIMKFRNAEEIKKFAYSTVLTVRNYLLETIKNYEVKQLAEFLKVDVQELNINKAKQLWEDYCEKFVRLENINGVKVLKVIYPRVKGSKFEYRMYWPYNALQFSVFDIEDKEEFYRGLFLLGAFLKHRPILSSRQN